MKDEGVGDDTVVVVVMKIGSSIDLRKIGRPGGYVFPSSKQDFGSFIFGCHKA